MTRKQGIGFAVFCLIAGSRWLMDQVSPARLTTFEAASFHYLLVGAVAGFILIVRGGTLSAARVPWFQLAIASSLFLSLPLLLIEAAHGVSTATQIGLFALVPLLVVVGAGSFGEEQTQSRMLMMPAIIGLSGVLLLVPFQFPSSPASSFSFLLSLVAGLLTAVGSLWIDRLLRRCGWVLALVVLCGTNALVMGFVSAMTPGLVMPRTGDLMIEFFRGAVLDLPLLFLLVWLLKGVSPPRLATRFLLVPLLSTGEAVILLHSSIDLRMVCGIVLIMIASFALLFWRASDGLESTSSLGLL